METLARKAGIGKRTLERIESGYSVQLVSLVRIFRELDLLGVLESLLPQSGPRPLDILKLQGKVRKRASHASARERDTSKWTWGDEQ